MRVILVGSAIECARLRSLLARLPGLAGAAVEVVGEAPTLAAARAADLDADAYLVASNTDAFAHDPITQRTVSGAPRRGRADRTAAGTRGWDPEHRVVEEPLTPREIQVLELLAEGLPNKAIAARLDISDQTIKFHVSSICGKLGAANRTDAVRRAVRQGIITL